MPPERDDPARRRWSGTVRLRITVVAVVAVAVVLAATAIVVVAVQRRVLVEQLDEALASDADRLLATTPLSVDAVDAAVLPPGRDDDAVAQVVTTPGGEVVAATANLSGRPAIVPVDGDLVMTASEIDVGDQRSRLVVRRGQTADGRNVVALVAAPLDDIDGSLRALAVSMAVVFPFVTALLAAVVFFLVGRTLRPVEQIRADVASIGPNDLDRRVPLPPGQDEIVRLAATMNAMLDRLDASSRRQRRFVADASHELRTPLARMRTEIEVDLRRPDGADPAATSHSVLEEVDAMQRLIDDLLELARIDADRAGAARRLVDLDDIVLAEVSALQSTGVDVDARGVSAAQVTGVPEQLRRVIRNVLDNAVRHAGSGITVAVGETDGHAVVTIADDGPGIPPERREEIFERFTTLDDARTARGAGLGLAIARDIVTAHGGTIGARPHNGPGTVIAIELPVASSS